ncbi:MAG: cell division ATP-binding protein FtsE [bacterium]
MIYFEKVSKLYKTKEGTQSEALDDISLHIKPGEMVSIVGHSGSGKTTLIKLINREIKPDQGKIFIGGLDYDKLKKRDIPYLRRKIGVVFQDYKLLPKKTVFENVAYALEVAGVKVKDIKERVPNILELVGLSDKVNCFPRELSGGERQRVAIARALVHQPRILVADEPTGNLDPKISWDIVEILLKINEMGTTIIMTTHNVTIVNKLKKRVIKLSDGKIVRDEKMGRYGTK